MLQPADGSMSSPVAMSRTSDELCFMQTVDHLATDRNLFGATTGERVVAKLDSKEVQIATTPKRLGISADNQWIQEDGADVIWIPSEQRPKG